MDGPAAPAWSEAVEQADWIGARLASFDSYQVTSVIPGGFEAYSRVLHPAEDSRWGHRVVRWAQVAAWSGMPLGPGSQFHSVALPPEKPPGRAPWSGQGPRQGSMYVPDAAVLAGILREHTGTPGQCWFGLWEGYGLAERPISPESGEPAAPRIVPGNVLVHLPKRDYLLYSGPVEAAVATAEFEGVGQTANLWWPQDRAWFVASEIDLPWTYVAGPAALIGELLAADRIEALPAGPHDPLTRVERWVQRWAAEATESLLSAGRATVRTPRGTVQAWLQRPGSGRPGALSIRSEGENGIVGGGTYTFHPRREWDLHRAVCQQMTMDIVELVGG